MLAACGCSWLENMYTKLSGFPSWPVASGVTNWSTADHPALKFLFCQMSEHPSCLLETFVRKSKMVLNVKHSCAKQDDSRDHAELMRRAVSQ